MYLQVLSVTCVVMTYVSNVCCVWVLCVGVCGVYVNLSFLGLSFVIIHSYKLKKVLENKFLLILKFKWSIFKINDWCIVRPCCPPYLHHDDDEVLWYFLLTGLCRSGSAVAPYCYSSCWYAGIQQHLIKANLIKEA